MPNKICLRCGISNKELAKEVGCSHFGTHYKRHLWGKEKKEIELPKLVIYGK